MAKVEKGGADYGAEIKRLRSEGPARVYILRGEEDYLRDSFLEELKKQCLVPDTETFNHHRLQGQALDMAKLAESVEAMPFMGERTLVEVRDFDVNKTSAYDPERLKSLLSDIPEWATVVFLFGPEYSPDSRLGAVKAMKKAGYDLAFSSPRENELIRWVSRRVEGQGKSIEGADARYLIWVCGARMNTLIPEIIKIAGYAQGEFITKRDIDAVARRAPETTIFNLTDALGSRAYDKAAGLLADLLADRDEPPQKQLAMVSEQFRRLYVARVAADSGRGEDYITSCIPELAGRAYPLRLLKGACKNYSQERLARAVSLCVQCDYRMKDTGGEPEALMKELLTQLAMDRS
ncbi:MAG: DNA polymerase III subunit delta [Oscillospiraceae bacterium]|nr:DNA polymerase III subunit delta [Oscillospiraceae bacterium]